MRCQRVRLSLFKPQFLESDRRSAARIQRSRARQAADDPGSEGDQAAAPAEHHDEPLLPNEQSQPRPPQHDHVDFDYMDDGYSGADAGGGLLGALPDVYAMDAEPAAARTAAQRNARAEDCWQQRRAESHFEREWPSSDCDTVQLLKEEATQRLLQLEGQRASHCPCCGSSGPDSYPVQRQQEVQIVQSDFSFLLRLPVRLCNR